MNRIFTWEDLNHLLSATEEAYHAVQHYHQEKQVMLMGMYCQVMAHLAQKRTETLGVSMMDEAAMMSLLSKDTDPVPTCAYHALMCFIHFIEGRYDQAIAQDTKARPHYWSLEVLGLVYIHYRAWATLAEFAAVKPGSDLRRVKKKVAPLLKLFKDVAKANPSSYSWIDYLCQAELARLEGRNGDALKFYQRANLAAGESQFLAGQAVAHERSARYYLGRGDRIAGTALLREARHFYSDWGAIAKVKLLDEEFPAVKQAEILKTQQASVTTTSTMNLGEGLDLESICRACQSISRELSLENLIQILAKITLESAGARRGLIFLMDDDNWHCHIEANLVEGFNADLTTRELAGLGDQIATSVVNFVKRSRTPVTLDNAATSTYSRDPYIVRTQCLSIACIPIESRGEMLGILYLENELTSAAFTPGRMRTLSLLAAQGAISIRNVQYLADAKDKVRLEDQLRAAQAVQNALLPGVANIPGYAISTHYTSADETGGDWYGYQYDEARGRLYVQIGDVTGHGVPSALVTGAACGAILSAYELLSKGNQDDEESCLESLVIAANCAVSSAGVKSGRWMTMAFVMIDIKTGSALYANAGHLPVYLRHGDVLKSVIRPSDPLGALKKIEFARFQMEPGDILFMMTDGLIENGGQRPEKRMRELRKIIINAGDEGELKEKVNKNYDDNMKGLKPGDDCTFLALRRSA
jgi:serine phosphatase RsbU (regulator of sigma subunit)